MTTYTSAEYETGPLPSVKEAIAALGTKLETLDDTANTIYMYGITQLGSGTFVGWMVYKG